MAARARRAAGPGRAGSLTTGRQDHLEGGAAAAACASPKYVRRAHRQCCGTLASPSRAAMRLGGEECLEAIRRGSGGRCRRRSPRRRWRRRVHRAGWRAPSGAARAAARPAMASTELVTRFVSNCSSWRRMPRMSGSCARGFHFAGHLMCSSISARSSPRHSSTSWPTSMSAGGSCAPGRKLLRRTDGVAGALRVAGDVVERRAHFGMSGGSRSSSRWTASALAVIAHSGWLSSSASVRSS